MQLENEKYEYPVIGKEYNLFREGNLIGRAFYLCDEIHGPCFMKNVILDNGEPAINIFFNVDDWQEVEFVEGGAGI